MTYLEKLTELNKECERLNQMKDTEKFLENAKKFSELFKKLQENNLSLNDEI